MPKRTETHMGTLVTIEIVADSPDAGEALDHAFDWFHDVEECCSRFEPTSEMMQLAKSIGTPVKVSPILFETLQFACMVAEESGGAFDPAGTSYRDIRLDPVRGTVTLRKPLTLDLGAVAKGMAVDAAARELQPFRDFVIDAGGDLYLGGFNPKGRPWSVGVRHPKEVAALIETVELSDAAICTSGNYEKPAPHIVDPRTRQPALLSASATVIAPAAMMADALATAAFVLGPVDGIELLTRNGVEGMIVTPDLKRFQTAGFRRA